MKAAQDSKRSAYLLVLYSYFTDGAMALTVNAVLKSILAEYQWTDGQGGLLIACMSAGLLVSSLIGNSVMERLGRNRTMTMMGLFICVSLGLFSLSPWPVTFYPLVFVAGLAWGGINSLANTIVNELYDGSASRLNIMHACFACSAVLFPLLVGVITMQGGSWRIVPRLVAVLGAILAVLSCRIPLPKRPEANTADTSTVPFWREPRFYFSLLTLFTYVGCESSASAWLSSYLSRSNTFFQAVPSETMVSLMWLLMIVGRLFFAAVGTKVPKALLLTGESVAFLLGMLGMITFADNTAAAITSVAFMGLGMSAIYGTAIASYARYVSCSTLSAELLFGAGGLGSTLIPALAGAISDRAGLQTGMFSLCGFLLVLVLTSFANLCMEKRSAVHEKAC